MLVGAAEPELVRPASDGLVLAAGLRGVLLLGAGLLGSGLLGFGLLGFGLLGAGLPEVLRPLGVVLPEVGAVPDVSVGTSREVVGVLRVVVGCPVGWVVVGWVVVGWVVVGWVVVGWVVVGRVVVGWLVVGWLVG